MSPGWQKRSNNRDLYHDLPGPTDWVEVQYMAQLGSWWAFRLSKPASPGAPPALGPFGSAEEAKREAESRWIRDAGQESE